MKANKPVINVLEPDDKFTPGHHMGESCGYDVTADGSIVLAPALTKTMIKCFDREAGLRLLLKATNEYANDEFTRISEERRLWWLSVERELRIILTDGWSFDNHAGVLSRIKKEEK